MRNFKKFEKSRDVRIVSPNPNEIKAIMQDSLNRFKMFILQKDQKGMTKYVFENLYESLRELSECITLRDGFKIYSHEIMISYLLHRKILDEGTASIFDNFRKLRNQSKYYGEKISSEKLIESLKDIKKIRSILLIELKKLK